MLGRVWLIQIEEDNDDFLDEVIEFGDGRQYKVVETADGDGQPPSNSSPPSGPVHKEDRFADDFDRSWPRSGGGGGGGRPPPPANAWGLRPRGGPGVPAHGPDHDHGADGPRGGWRSGRAGSSTSSLSPQEPSRVLFNERSNRLEPYANAHSRGGPGASFPPCFFACLLLVAYAYFEMCKGYDIQYFCNR